jgi:hypothetical protein
VGGAVRATQILPALRDLYSRHPEYMHHVLYSLGYVDNLADEAQIAAADEQ